MQQGCMLLPDEEVRNFNFRCPNTASAAQPVTSMSAHADEGTLME